MIDHLLYNLIHLTSKQTQSSWALISTKSLWAYTEIFNNIVSAEGPTLKLGKKELIGFGLEMSRRNNQEGDLLRTRETPSSRVMQD